MTTFTQLIPAYPDPPSTDRLRLAVAAYLARFKGFSREHTESDLRCYLSWCAEHGLDPLAARRPHLKLYIRWMQEIRRFKTSTVYRRFSVTAGSYRTCVLDGIPSTDLQLFWQRASLFLLMNTAVATVYVSIGQAALRPVLAVFALITTVFWFLVMRASAYWIDHWRQELARLEAIASDHRLFTQMHP